MTVYRTNDTDLKKVADAIRSKGGTSADLTYPNGFVTAIGNIQTGTDTSDATLDSNRCYINIIHNSSRHRQDRNCQRCGKL